jgi:hypothetical protein
MHQRCAPFLGDKDIMTKTYGLIALLAVALVACGNPHYKLLTDLENMPKPDYSYVVQPVFLESAEAIESKVKALYSAEEVRFSISRYHKYDDKTRQQTDERFWIHCTLFNSNSIDINSGKELQIEGQKIAELVMTGIENRSDYDKVQITFIKQWYDGTVKQIKYPFYYTYPDLKSTTFDDNMTDNQ